jgi:hypothetical protein
VNPANSFTSGNKRQLPQVGNFREIAAEPKNPLGQKLAKKWIEDCLHNHTSCDSGIAAQMPTRLLDTLPNEDNAELRLIKDFTFPVKYAALSHCWGGCETAKTTSDNIDSMTRSIQLSNLPKTFQDAVYLCRELKIRYLWIDSLCIVQNDASEWRHEAGRMTMVYGNAFLVLVASASWADDFGMFPRRRYHYNHQIEFEWNGQAIILNAQPWRNHLNQHSASRTGGGEGPLSLRAWAFQERLLGQWLLLYHHDELFWECNEISRCECGVGDRKGSSKHPYNLREIFGKGQESAASLYEEWRNTVVPNYAYRSLTKASDKLPAISGVAGAFRSKLDDEYLAGLWRKDLIRGLLWCNTLLLCHTSTGPVEYRAPSWSWASTDICVDHYNIINETVCVDISEAHCQPVADEPTGEVSGGWITLSGMLMKASITLPQEHFGIPIFNTPGFVHKDGKPKGFIPDRLLMVGSTQINENIREDTALRVRAAYSVQQPNNDCAQNPPSSPAQSGVTSVWCLRVVQATMEYKELYPDTTDLFLVLGRSQSQQGKFERLGIMAVPTTDSEPIVFANATRTTIIIV